MISNGMTDVHKMNRINRYTKNTEPTKTHRLAKDCQFVSFITHSVLQKPGTYSILHKMTELQFISRENIHTFQMSYNVCILKYLCLRLCNKQKAKHLFPRRPENGSKQKSSKLQSTVGKNEKLEDMKWVIRGHEQTKDRQYTDQKKWDEKTNNYLHRKLNIWPHEPHCKSVVNSCASEL